MKAEVEMVRGARRARRASGPSFAPASLIAPGLALALAACGASPAAQAGSNGSDIAVAELRTLEIRAEASGLIEPIRVVEVKSKASGEILRLHVETGDRVEQGTLLAEVDPRDVRNALAQAEADLEVARARVSTAESQRRRSEELRRANVITEQEFENTELDLANARAQLVKAQTNLELARERMSDVTIRAPLAGTIIQKNVEVGQIIQSASQNISGGTTLFLMADLAEMQVRTLVDETDIGQIQPGQPARVRVEAFPNRTFVGRVLKIEPQAVVEQNVTMFPVLVRLDNREGLLKPGMNAEVQIEIARRADVVTVPNAAVVSMRDAAAAGAVLGLDPEALRAALRGGSGGEGGMAAARGARRDDARAGSSPEATGSGPSLHAAAGQGGDAGRGNGESPANGEAASNGPADDCAGLRDKLRGGGLAALSDEERARARDCMRQARDRDSGDAPGATGDVRPGVVFVRGPNGPEPRRVLLGLNDWDYSEIVRGVEAGEEVILMSVARLQQQQQEMLDRIRQRSGGPIPGARGGRGR